MYPAETNECSEHSMILLDMGQFVVFTNTRREERREVKVVRGHGERRGEYL